MTTDNIRIVPGSQTGDWPAAPAEQYQDDSAPLVRTAAEVIAELEREDGDSPSEDTEAAPGPSAPEAQSQFKGDPTETRGEATVATPSRPRRTRTVREASEASYRPCRCSLFRVMEPNGDTRQTTECSANVISKRSFAPGHDAKLKSMLIQAGRSGYTAVRTDDGIETGSTNIPGLLTEWPKLAAAVQHAIANKPKGRTSTRRDRPTETEVSDMTEVKASRMAVIKVGRWTYEAEILPNGRARFEDHDGGTHEAGLGDYTEVESNYHPEGSDDF